MRFLAQGTGGAQYAAAPENESSKFTLRMKGIIGFVALVAYVTIAGILIAQQRDQFLRIVEELEQIHSREDTLTKVSTSLAHAVLVVNEAYFETQVTPRFDSIVVDVEAVQARLQGLVAEYPGLSRLMERVNLNVAALRAMPVRSSMLELPDNLHALVGELDLLTREVRERRKTLSGAYRIVYDSMAVTAVGMGLAGVILFGGIIGLFFSRLAWDINTLGARARQVIKGYRGEPLRVTRKDEVGKLMEAVNQMQSDLRSREQQLEIVRQQRFHQEKMVAIGSLASAIAHEINNPIAAIAGVAEEMCRTQKQQLCHKRGSPCAPDLILGQAQRIARISRQISELTAPQSEQVQLMDINGLIRRTSNFLRYDQRLRGIEVNLDLDDQLPALHGVPDEVTQVVVNLLINAADAVVAAPDRHGRIDVATRLEDGNVVISVSDNGSGISEAAYLRAFEEGFTTKPNGSGIGLFMCKSLVEARGGTIGMISMGHAGTQLRVCLPIGTEAAIE